MAQNNGGSHEECSFCHNRGGVGLPYVGDRNGRGGCGGLKILAADCLKQRPGGAAGSDSSAVGANVAGLSARVHLHPARPISAEAEATSGGTAEHAAGKVAGHVAGGCEETSSADYTPVWPAE